MKNKLKTIKTIILFLVLWFFIHGIYISYDGLTDKNSKADVAIVLGNKVNEDKTLTERLKQRLNQSIKLYNQNRVKKIIVSGGLGKKVFGKLKKCVII